MLADIIQSFRVFRMYILNNKYLTNMEIQYTTLVMAARIIYVHHEWSLMGSWIVVVYRVNKRTSNIKNETPHHSVGNSK